MDIAESIGFLQFWGFTQSENFMENAEGDYKILLSGNSDIRHLLRSISEECTNDRECQITFYLQEGCKEVLARQILLVLIVNDMALPIRERVEIFLDVYANALTRERTAEYVQGQAQNLIKILTQHRDAPALQSMFDLSALKFKERDDLEEVCRSWFKNVEFDMGGLRDQRLRFHYKERYDHRNNLADWDYHWNYKELAPQVNYRHYKEWRLSGVAYEFRLATYTSPNRTMSGYIPGKKKVTRDSVMVRGFWGDIVNSPYWAFGLDVNCCETCTEILNKVASTDRVHHEGDISEFNLTKMLTRMDTLNEYHFPPEKDRMIAIKKYWAGEEVKVEEIKEVDEEEVRNIRSILLGFEKFRVKIVPVLDSIVSMAGKRKFQGIFDRVVVGGASSFQSAEGFDKLGNDKCVFSVEKVSNVIVLKKEDKAAVLEKVREIATAVGWVEVGDRKNYTDFQKNQGDTLVE